MWRVSEDFPTSDEDEKDGLKFCLDVNDRDITHNLNGDLHHFDGDVL